MRFEPRALVSQSGTQEDLKKRVIRPLTNPISKKKTEPLDRPHLILIMNFHQHISPISRPRGEEEKVHCLISHHLGKLTTATIKQHFAPSSFESFLYFL
jgi:hypothetical protein